METNKKEIDKLTKKYVKPLTAKQLYTFTHGSLTTKQAFLNALGLIPNNDPLTEKAAHMAIIIAIKNIEQSKEPYFINFHLFALSYPQSIGLIDDYYEALKNACLEDHKIMKFDGKSFSPFQNKSEKDVINKLQTIPQALITLHLMIQESLKEFKNTIDNDILDQLINKYNYFQTQIDKRDQKKTLAEELYEKLINDYIHPDAIQYVYNINVKDLDRLFKVYLNATKYNNYKEKIKQIEHQEYLEIEEIIKIMFNGIDKGIEVNGTITPFSILDYYCLTLLEPAYFIKKMLDEKAAIINKEKKLIEEAQDEKIEFDPKDTATKTWVNRCVPFLSQYRYPERDMTEEKLKQDTYILEMDGIPYKIADYAQFLIEEFKKNKIPPKRALLINAFRRHINNIPMFPLLHHNEMVLKLQ